MRAYQEQIAALEEQIAKLTAQKTSDLTSKETLSHEISDLKVEFAAKNEQYRNSKERFTLLKQDLDESEQKLAIFKEDLQLLIFRNDAIAHREKSSLRQQQSENSRIKKKRLQLISSRRQERLQLQTTLEDLEIDAKELKRLHKGMVEVLKDEEVKINRLDVELENRLNHLQRRIFAYV